MIYNLILAPLILVLEVFFKFLYEITSNCGIAIIGLSFFVTLITLPLYMKADSWQEVERKKQTSMKPGIDRIKSVFKGDEQYMILNCYYKQNHYHPIYALRSSFSLLILIPFFLAAYRFLSNLSYLQGTSFLFIKDLSKSDSSFKLGNFTINILPILMTLLNCISGYIYTYGHEKREKIQIYLSALIFLVILYKSPSGLVIYWTMNNLLSLVKNIFYKIKNPKKVLYIVLCIFSFSLLAIAILKIKSLRNIYIAFLILLGIILPITPILLKKIYNYFNSNFNSINTKQLITIFITSIILLTLLSGLYIPSIIIESEPHNFCYIDNYSSPFYFLRTVLYQSIGIFLLWPIAIFFLFNDAIKKILTLLFSILSYLALINVFFFSGKYGPLDTNLLFMQVQSFIPPIKNIIIHLLVTLSLILVVLLLFKYKSKLLNYFNYIICFALIFIGIKNSINITKTYKNIEKPDYTSEIEPVFHLSKKNNNVLVFFLDRCFSPYVPYIFDEFPELKEQFEGFINYPNTVSMGNCTMVGSPGLMGGYDYTPFEINKRSSLTMQEKHNQAILTMPVLFMNADYNSYIANLPYENYLEQPVINAYKDYPELNRENIVGPYSRHWYLDNNMEYVPYLSMQIKRNLLCFSIFKMSAPVLRAFIYHEEYWNTNNLYENTNARFIDNYSALDYLPELFDFTSEKGSFVLMDNEAIHEPIYLQAPDFVPSDNITDKGNPKFDFDSEYNTMCGAFKRLGEFFDYLKENNIYDNTRIIIVSDHGYSNKTGLFNNDDKLPFIKEDVLATLMYKDFNSKGLLSTDMTFMTNADTPYLASKNIIENAKNPFTNNELRVNDKNEYVKIMLSKPESTRIRHNHSFTVNNDEWFTVKNNIFDDTNWDYYYNQYKIKELK